MQRFFTAVILSDSHIGYESRQAHHIAINVIADVQPQYVIHLGDLLDCFSISRFSKDPLRVESLQSEINEGHKLLCSLASAAPKATKYLLEGNHERRLSRVIQSLTGEARELARLDTVIEAVQWPRLLKLSSPGFKWIPHEKQPLADVIPGMLLKHGDVVRKFSAYTAKGEFDKYHASGISGHTHRLGTCWTTDYNGQHVWIENGHLTDPTKADYCSSPAWQQGFTVLSWLKGSHQLPTIEQIHIQAGRALFRGVIYQ